MRRNHKQIEQVTLAQSRMWCLEYDDRKKKHRQKAVRNDSPLPVLIANHERVEHPEN